MQASPALETDETVDRETSRARDPGRRPPPSHSLRRPSPLFSPPSTAVRYSYPLPAAEPAVATMKQRKFSFDIPRLVRCLHEAVPVATF